jgi:DNA-directed RNA polymerase subunit RPC12/RpoP
MLLGIQIAIEMDCTGCNTKFPLRGLQETSVCHNCLSKVSFPAVMKGVNYNNWLRNIVLKAIAVDEAEVAADERSDDEEEEEYVGYNATIMLQGTFTYSLQYIEKLPFCQQCGTEFSDSEIKTSGGQLNCRKCEQITPIRHKDERLINWCDPDLISYVVNDSHQRDGSELELGTAMKTAQVLPCMSCSVGLTLDGSSRTVQCTYCSSHNYVPFDIWIRMHPVPGAHPFFVVVDLEAKQDMILLAKTYCLFSEHLTDQYNDIKSPFMIGMDYRAKKTIKRLKKEIGEGLRGMNNQQRLEFATNGNPEVRMMLVKMIKESPELQQLLAADPHYIVRKKMAMSQDSTAEILESLAMDEHEEVKFAVAKRADLPLHIMQAFATDDDRYVREAIASNPAATKAILRKLYHDSEFIVRAAVQKNKNFKRGLLARILSI